MKQSIILSAFLMLALTSCEDFFQTTVEIELPEHEAKLTYSGFAYLLNDTLNVSHVISHSKGTLDNDPVDIQNGKYVLKTDDKVLVDETLLSFANTYLDTSEPLVAGNQYDITVSADGWEDISASQVLPKAVEIETVEYEANGGIDEFGEPADTYSITFTDDGDEENYYFVSGLAKVTSSYTFDGVTYTDTYEDNLYFTSTDPTVTQMWGFNGAAIKDAAFNGKEYSLRLNSYPVSYNESGNDFSVELESVNIKLFSLSKEAYNFLVSLQLYKDARDNPFSEPVVVFENIENGYGIFALANATEKIVEF